MAKDCFFFGALTITDAELVSGPPDAESQVYDAGDAPFDEGDERWDAGHVFRSLVPNNSAALTDPASWQDLGEVDDGALPWDAGTTYGEGQFAILNHRKIQSATAGNTSLPSEANWTDAGPTNRFRAFDLKSNKPALLLEKVEWVFSPPSTVNAMLLMLPRGGTATVEVRSSTGTLLFEQDYRLTRDSGGGPYNYHWSPIERVGRVIVHGLPPGASNIITVKVSGSASQQVGLGQIAMGFAHNLGTTTTGSGVRASSFKDATEDQFGNITFPNAANRRTVVMKFAENALQIDNILSRVGPYLNQPAGLYMVDGVRFGLAVYGLVREVDLPIDNPVLTEGTVEMRGFAE